MEDEGVLVLGAHNFAPVTERFILMLVLLYTPGCDGCAALLEEYVRASDDLYEHLIPAAKVSLFRGYLPEREDGRYLSEVLLTFFCHFWGGTQSEFLLTFFAIFGEAFNLSFY